MERESKLKTKKKEINRKQSNKPSLLSQVLTKQPTILAKLS